MSENLLEIEGLTAGYEGVPVVRDLTLSLGEGEVVVVLGPNGAGKTTTLLTVSGLLPVMSGSIHVMGRNTKKLAAHRIARLGLAHVPEDRSLFFQLTVAENLRLGATRGKIDLARVLHYFPALEGLMHRRAGLLSGGEQQMLAMGRALAMTPKLLIVDELSLGLAPVIVERLLPVLRAFAEETGAGVLLVEQHVDLALALADRAYVLSHGDLVMAAAAQELRDHPELLQASYLGEEPRPSPPEQH
jgi:branched-chain amino acid transport system ATP-binding protein